ncbi:hypothetical protein MEN41_07300, partial [Dolichospermum sp. ST_con]|nr:hypothetical protein [Dolichospermum sp. ST_con]
MKSFNILLNNFLDLDSILKQALENTSQYLSRFRFDAAYTSKLETAFGNDFNRSVANQLFNKLAQGDFSDIPTIEIVSRNNINGANGAFAIATGKIYLSQEFITANAHNLNAIVSVLLEEYGHYIDSQINTTDAAGDEGDIFARLVQGKSITQQELAVLRAEDDSATVMLDGYKFQIEMNNPSGTNVGLDDGIFGTGKWTNWEISGTINGTSNNDEIAGFGGNDTIYGDGGDDALQGNYGDDVIYGGSGTDSIDGGPDWDRVDYKQLDQAINVSSNDGTVINVENKLGLDELWDVEHIIGSDLNDTIYGHRYGSWMITTGGEVYVYTNTGLKYLQGEQGNDQLFAGKDQANWLYGGDGNDILYADVNKDGYAQELTGGSGKDIFIVGGNIGDDKNSTEILKSVVDFGIGLFSAPNPYTAIIGAAASLLKNVFWKVETSGVTSDVVNITDFKLGEDVIFLPNLDTSNNEYYEFIVTGSNVMVRATVNNIESPVNIIKISNLDDPDSLANLLKKTWEAQQAKFRNLSQNLLVSDPQEANSGKKIVGGYFP